MLICPLDYRYGRKEMKEILSEEQRLRAQLRVEGSLALAHAEIGNIPKEDGELIAKVCSSGEISLERVKEIEKQTKHDVMAMVKAITERAGKAGKYVHLGATSNDIVDTAMALQIKQALWLIEQDIKNLINILVKLAECHRDTLMVARTHGQFAIPTTFGFKIAGYVSEMLRFLDRLNELKPRVIVGKMSGAVGTGAGFGPNFFKIQDLVMKDLGLEVEEVATQIVCRDRYAELASFLALLCTACERYATEVRNLQRTEIGEVMEAFDEKNQVGSSTMAQKRNPALSENLCGLARIVRGFVSAAYEDMILWHERDLTNSSAERFIIPHMFVLADDILIKTAEIFEHLKVNKEKMLLNLESSRGMIMSEAVMLALVSKGMGRQDAHEVIRKATLNAEKKGEDLKKVLMRSKIVRKYLNPKELDKIMDY
ncbi:MAG: adenylosuccinate lyase, partial [Methanomassiliicoccales archaeon]